MKILFVSMVPFESKSSATIQNKGIIKGLSELGHDIDILTLEPYESAILYDDSMNDILPLINKRYYIKLNTIYKLFMAKKDTNRIKKSYYTTERSNLLKLILRRIRNFIKKTYDYFAVFDALKLNVKGVSKLKLEYKNYDIIISASDPKSSHLIVKRIYKDNPGCKARWIQYWGDPMLHDITRKKGWKDGLVKYHEQKIIKKADKVVYASPLTLEKQKQTFPQLSWKMDYANQACVDFQTKSIVKDERAFQLNEINVGYFGAYQSSVRNIMPLYNAAKMGNFNLTICGPSDVLLESTKNVVVHKSVPYREAVEMETKSDILICICNSRGTQIPGKIYYCAGYNKPIILVLDGEYQEELREYCERFGRYIICENNEDSIIDAIKKAKTQLNKAKYTIHEQLTPKFMASKILGE